MSNDTIPSNSIIILSPTSQVFVDNAGKTIAPWVIGPLVDIFLQGILTVQVTNYFTYQSAASHRKRTWLVIGLTALCILKSIQNILNAWELVITSYCNPDVAVNLLKGEWRYYTAPLVTAVIAIVVQSFFVHRYWRLTKRWYICVPIIFGMIISLTGSIMVVAVLSNPPKLGLKAYPAPVVASLIKALRLWFLVHFISAILVDVAITTATAWYLYKQKPFAARSTSETIDRLIRMVWQSALPPTLCVIINAVFIPTAPSDYVHIAVNRFLPKLYAISLMYTLNLGQEMYARPGESNGVSLTPQTGLERISFHRSLSVGTDQAKSKEAEDSLERDACGDGMR